MVKGMSEIVDQDELQHLDESNLRWVEAWKKRVHAEEEKEQKEERR